MGTESGADFIGAACIVRYGPFLIFEVEKPHKWARTSDVLRVGISCIGGKVEPGESPVEALQRECDEEIGLQVEVCSSETTVSWAPEGTLRQMDWTEGCPRPALVWEGHGPGFVPGRQVAVFIGAVWAEPVVTDLPAVLLIRPDVVLDILAGEWSLRRVLERGGRIIAREVIPPDAILEPQGTLLILREMAVGHPNEVRRLLALT